MASNKRKKTFPKPPQRFHSKLETELGRWSNKTGFDASIKAIYSQPIKKEQPLTEQQAKQLAKLKEGLAKREGYDRRLQET